MKGKNLQGFGGDRLESQSTDLGKEMDSFPEPGSGSGPGRVPTRRVRFSRRAPVVISTVLATVLLVLTTILVLNNGALPIGKSPQSGNPLIIQINGIDRQIVYKGSWGGYFGPGVNDSCEFCPVGAQAGAAIRIPLGTWNPPANLSFWIFTNISGPFLVQGAGCSPAPCMFPWLTVESLATYVPAGTLAAMTLYGVFLMPDLPSNTSNIINLNATLCPTAVCPPPST
jgi:hypothetical protein